MFAGVVGRGVVVVVVGFFVVVVGLGVVVVGLGVVVVGFGVVVVAAHGGGPGGCVHVHEHSQLGEGQVFPESAIYFSAGFIDCVLAKK